MSDMVMNVPRKLRRGGRANDEEDSVNSGLELIKLMCRRFEVSDLGNLALFDMGCGVKLVQALLENDLPVGRYVGVDVYEAQIQYLNEQVRDSRFSFHHANIHNEMYNPKGLPLNDQTRLPLEAASFDVICLFSVFTHLAPHDYVAMLKLLRPYIKPGGRLLFSLFVYETTPGGHGFIDSISKNMQLTEEQLAAWDGPPDFRDWDPSDPLHWALYSRDNAIALVEGTGWEIESLNDPEEFIQHYMICRPV
ncbi:MAG: class I SAM-dependent methyltransferase [Pseudomonadota bacterium]